MTGVGKQVDDFFQVVKEGDLSAVKRLLASEPDLANSMRDPDEWSNEHKPLHEAVGQGHVSIVQELLDSGAEADAVNTFGWRPTHCAVKVGLQNSQAIIELLLSHGAEIDAVVGGGMTPLHVAVKYERRDLVDYLLSQGAEVNTHVGNGQTPLHAAAFTGDLETIQLLIAHGADPCAKDRFGRTPAGEADRNDKEDAHRVLSEATPIHKKKEAPIASISPERIRSLIDLMGQQSSSWFEAYEALRQIGGPAVDPVIEAMHSSNKFLRLRAMDLLAKIGDPRAIRPLKKASSIRKRKFLRMAGRGDVVIQAGSGTLTFSPAELLDEYRNGAAAALALLKKTVSRDSS